MKNPLLLAIFLVGLLVFITFYVTSKVLYYKRHQVKYHFYQMFPYEFNFPSVFKENIFGNVLLFLSLGAVMVFYDLNPLKSLYSTVAIILAIVLTMLIIILVLLPLKYLRTHMAISTITMSVSTILPVFNLFLALDQYRLVPDPANKVLAIISMVISGVLALSMLALILNPKLTYQIYLDKSVDENGNEVFNRPKIIFVALNEWWAIFVFIMSPLAVLLLNII